MSALAETSRLVAAIDEYLRRCDPDGEQDGAGHVAWCALRRATEEMRAALSSAPDAPTCARCNRPMTPEEAEAFRCCASCWVALHSMGGAPTEPSRAAIHAAIGAAAAAVIARLPVHATPATGSEAVRQRDVLWGRVIVAALDTHDAEKVVRLFNETRPDEAVSGEARASAANDGLENWEGEVLDMIVECLESLGTDMKGTPPMCYDDAIQSTVFRWAKRALDGELELTPEGAIRPKTERHAALAAAPERPVTAPAPQEEGT